MQHNWVSTITAMYDSWWVEFHVDGTASSRPCFRRPKFRYSHGRTS